ncbi:sensor histidine kinase [Paraclostridium bifermentans]|uniref:sensor histidine kinase n=2 Tax=Paraclostridium bifermentans TaxID=1490 RepID=UPI00359C8102
MLSLKTQIDNNIYNYRLEETIKISIEDLIFMAIPEAIVIFCSIGVILKYLNKKNIIRMILAYLVAIYILKNYFPIGINSLLLYISTAIIVWKYSKVNIIKCFITTATIVVIKLMTEVMTILFINILGINLQSILDNYLLRILSCYASLILMIIFMKLVRYKYFIDTVDIKNISEKNKYLKHTILYISVLIMTIAGILILFMTSADSIVYNFEGMLNIFIVISLVTILILLLFTIINYDKRKALDELEINLMEKNMKQMEDSVDALRVQRHDYMNHLQIILMQMSNGKVEDAKKYILGMADCDNNITKDFITGNHYIDAILNTKKVRAMKYNIDLTACIDSSLENIELSDSEISSVFLNIIDNAIDELKKSTKEYKYVHVDTYKEEDYHYVSISNNGLKIENTKKIFEKGYSSKGENRGYGLYSIKELLESYQCTINVYSDDMETEFNIKIPIIKKYLV